MDAPIPTNIPKKGFYYHYKHDPSKDLRNYVYEVVGLTRHSETSEFCVAYRPLYKNTYFNGVDYSVRPLNMFNETVTLNGKVMPRFRLITDEKVLAELKKIKEEMYDH